MLLAMLAGFCRAFAPRLFVVSPSTRTQKTLRFMSMEMAPPTPPAIQIEIPNVRQSSPGEAPTSVRYSDFLKRVRADQVDKVRDRNPADYSGFLNSAGWEDKKSHAFHSILLL
jgi:hypothetical protein